MPFVRLGCASIEYAWVRSPGARAPAIVLLHEGLGSLAMWRDFPERLQTAVGHDVLVYSREGYGRSSVPQSARTPRYMHEEALQVLPELLDALDIERPILLGHSDGASIALIHAGGSARGVSALILLAPHVLVEEISLRSIAAANSAYEHGELRARLARYHEHVDAAFRGWNDAWLAPEFRSWNIEEFLPRITCPVLAIQGEEDEYGTMEQLARIERAISQAEFLKLKSCGHAPHRDCTAAVLEAIGRFLDRSIATQKD